MLGFRSARSRAILAGVVLVVVLAGIGTVAVWRAHDMRERHDRLEHTSVIAFALEDAEAEFRREEAALSALVFSGDRALVDAYQDAAAAIEQHLSQARASALAEGKADEVLALDDLTKRIGQFNEKVNLALPVLLEADPETAVQLATAAMWEMAPEAEGIIADLEEMVQAQQSQLAADAAAANRAADTTLWLTVGLSAFAFAVAAGVAVLVLSVVRPLAALRASARAITAGDLEARARVCGPEEVASLARDFNAMTDALAARTEAVQRSESRYRLLAENVTDVIWAMDTNLRFTYVSPSVTQLRGYTVEEAMAQTLEEFLTPASLEVAMKALAEERAIEKMEHKDLSRSQTLELEQVCKDGSTVWTEVKVGLLRDQDNRPVAILGVGRDISERKRAEDALRESERRFRTLSEAASEGIVIHKKGRILDASQRFAEMFGYEVSEVIGMHPWDFAAPDSRDLVLHAAVSGYEEPFEMIGLRKDGSTFVVEACGKATQYQGRPVAVAAIRDITARKRAEKALRKARENIESRVERRVQQVNGYGLTFRELTVLHLVAAGKADKEIATVLGISPLTAHKHLANILNKMGATTASAPGWTNPARGE